MLCDLAASDVTPQLSGCIETPFAWATPLPVLVEQSLTPAVARDRGRRIDVRRLIGTAELTVLAWDRGVLSHGCWRMYEDIEDVHGFWEPIGRAAVSPWQLARLMLRRMAARTADAPGTRTAASALPQYAVGTQTYCRLSDLPADLRARYEQANVLTPRPGVRGVSDAVFPHDIARFLAVDSWTGQGMATDPTSVTRAS